MKFKVTYEVWRETWNGHDECVDKETVIVNSTNAKLACKKAGRERLNPGKGRRFSHSIWLKNISVVFDTPGLPTRRLHMDDEELRMKA